MRPLTITYQITANQIAKLTRTEKDGRVRQRLRAIKFISQGQTIPQVARRMNISERPLPKWLHHFNKDEPKGLCDAPGPGQPPKINTRQIEKVKRVLPIKKTLIYLQVSIAGAGFEPATSGLWARRATRLLYPAVNW